ncbi:MAG: CoA activase [Deltaproteobacteria bacterium]|nr:CoA activase [Deltaproteobacteria bacterium]
MYKNKYLGIDIGAETIKTAIIINDGMEVYCTSRTHFDHDKNPERVLKKYLKEVNPSSFDGICTTGRLSSLLDTSSIPIPKAMAAGFTFFNPDITHGALVNIGGHGFSVLEMRGPDNHIYRENGRCSQGTGNFLKQLTRRFDLEVEQADELCNSETRPSPLSGRCPVILKTDMTHLANRGESKNQILAGLFDAVAENVEVLIKPAVIPGDIWLSGGVSKSFRIRKHIENFCNSKNISLHIDSDDTFMFYESVGAALEAMRLHQRNEISMVTYETIFSSPESDKFKKSSSLSNYLHMVNFMKPVDFESIEGDTKLLIGLDIGSTGSKGVAINAATKNLIFEHYTRTSGNPALAARNIIKKFKEHFNGKFQITGFGVTGSGREIAGSMLKTAFEPDRVYIMNEIAAHAKGAVYFDPTVDTIFEIGGQDAKYIRLSDGEVIDSAMNEACSAGTGSFIEEQGQRFEGINDITHMGEIALKSDAPISLGQHCSVFMAEVIDQALGANVDQNNVIAGIYDSVVSNYLNRVKGSRTIGNKIFCQGMPYSSPALAAATAAKTGRRIVIPPYPGLTGAIGIGLLAMEHLKVDSTINSVDAFINSKLVSRDTFVCKSTKGCGGTGNKCRIDRLKISVNNQEKTFIWGGQCSLYDKGGHGGSSLPDLSPDPFKYRVNLLTKLKESLTQHKNAPLVAVTDEFALKGLYPFFSTFINQLGFNIVTPEKGTREHLKRGIEENSVPYCAPMQLYGGITASMLDENPDIIFLPMIRDIEKSGSEPHSTVCPLSQASADIYQSLFGPFHKNTKFITDVIDMGQGNLTSDLFMKSITEIALSFGVSDSEKIEESYLKAFNKQLEFNSDFKKYCSETIQWAEKNNIIPVVVLGRAYTIHNDILNSNVPGILRQLGAVAIPVDGYHIEDENPVYNIVYWGYSQINLRAAHQIRKTEGIYSVFCSNYSCGPDSFNLHFADFILQGKPHATIETDGHSGDAGTKTRLEAFLHTVQNDLKNSRSTKTQKKQFKYLELDSPDLSDAKKRNDIILIPRMGEAAEVAAASLLAGGLKTETLDMPDQMTLECGRKHSSGKECLPATVTLGSLLKRIEKAQPEETFAFFMPTANGPCRFGMYNTFHKMVLSNLGYAERVKVISQPDSDYFTGVPKGLALRILAAFVTSDLLYDALLHTRVIEKIPGSADKIYSKYRKKLLAISSAPPTGLTQALYEVMGSLFGLRKLLSDAAEEFNQLKSDRNVPTVAVVGEIYVRLDPFSNDFIIKRLEELGIRPKLAPLQEWLEYTDKINNEEITRGRFTDFDGPVVRTISGFIQRTVQNRLYESIAYKMGWGPRLKPENAFEGAQPWLRKKLVGEAILTFGGPVYEFNHGEIDGVVSVGPLECMPNKISEAMYYPAKEMTSIPSVTFSLNGEPLDVATLENFVYEVKRSWENRKLKTSSEANFRA